MSNIHADPCDVKSFQSKNTLAELSQAAINDLYNSGLTPETICEMGVLPLTAASYAKFPSISKRPDDGYLIPFHGSSTPFARRKNLPAIPGDTGKPEKYSSPYDEGSHLYILPTDKSALASPKCAVIIPEGEKKTAKISQEVRKLATDYQKYGVVGMTGVSQFVSCPETSGITWKNRKVFLALDADVEFNSQNIQGIYRIIGFLVSHGVPLYQLASLAWNVGKGKGLDDYLTTQEGEGLNPVDVLRKLLENAISPFKIYRDKITLESGVEQIVKGADGTLTMTQIENISSALKDAFQGFTLPTIRQEIKRQLASHAPKIDSPNTIYLGSKEQVKEKLYHEKVSIISQNAWDMIIDKDRATRYFLRDTNPVFIENARPVSMTAKHLQSICDETITWLVRVGDSSSDTSRRSVPSDIPVHMIHSAAVRRIPLPEIERIVSAPYFGKDCLLQSQPGYSQKNATLYIQKGVSFHLADVPTTPTSQDVSLARSWIHEVLCDFPFMGYTERNIWHNAEKAHAVAMMLEPFIRSWFPITPLYLVEAPTSRTGKGLLVEACLYPMLGTTPGITTAPDRDEEWQKSITAILSDMPQAIVFDNVTHELKSQHLNSVLTAERWHQRKLGKNDESVTYPNMATWTATGNNVRLNTEMIDRTVRIRLTAACENPSERTGFRHAPLIPWIQEHRGEIVWSCLTLIQNYLAKGKPIARHPVSIGRFEEWARHMHGILEASGIFGFYENHEDLRVSNSRSSDNIKPLILEWLRAIEPISDESTQAIFTPHIAAKDLYAMFSSDPPIEIQGESETAIIRRLGTMLGRNKDAIFQTEHGEKWQLRGTDPRKTRNRVFWYLELYRD